MGGQLKIDAADTTLGEILSDVAALTGVKIDVPDGVSGVRIPSVTSGPGSAREVLTSLLDDSRCDFIIQAADTDPSKIQNVIVIARDKRGSAGAAPEMASSSLHGASAPSAAPADPREPAPPPVEANAPNLPPDEPAPPPSSAPSGDSMRQKLGMTDQYTFPKTSPVSPPAALSQGNISQQLLQMYQQRIQLNPQNGTATSAATPANPGGK